MVEIIKVYRMQMETAPPAIFQIQSASSWLSWNKIWDLPMFFSGTQWYLPAKAVRTDAAEECAWQLSKEA